MSYTLIDIEGKTYVECQPGVLCLRNEADALDLVAACGENETHRLMIHAGNLSPDFFDLSTRVAGEILLKFYNYRFFISSFYCSVNTIRNGFTYC